MQDWERCDWQNAHSVRRVKHQGKSFRADDQLQRTAPPFSVAVALAAPDNTITLWLIPYAPTRERICQRQLQQQANLKESE